jgi:hypothetical protein
MERIGLRWLRIGTSGGLLWTRYWTFGFHKMLGGGGVFSGCTNDSKKSRQCKPFYTTSMCYPIPPPFLIYRRCNKNNIFFWDVTPFGPSRVNRCFGGTFPQHLHGWRNQVNKESVRRQLAAFFLVPTSVDSFDREDVGDMFLWNVGWLSTDCKALYPQEFTLQNHRCEKLKPFTALNKLEILASCITGVLTM